MQAVGILVFLVLPAVIVAVGGIVAYVFLNEGFSPGKRKGRSAAVSRLPLLRGESLRRWAADVSKSVVAKYMSGAWSRSSAAAAAREIESEASLVIDRVVPRVSAARSWRCPDRGERTIQVTLPEAMAIAEELQVNLPAVEVRRVLARARANEWAAASADTAASGPALCPLLADDGHCLVYATRPLHCRARRCPNREPGVAPDATNERAAAAEFSLAVSEGMREGLAAALTTAGLDGQTYELNHSLVQTLGAS